MLCEKLKIGGSRYELEPWNLGYSCSSVYAYVTSEADGIMSLNSEYFYFHEFRVLLRNTGTRESLNPWIPVHILEPPIEPPEPYIRP